MKRFLVFWAPLYLYAGLIFYLSSIPKLLPEISIPYFDKFLHIIEYAVFGILSARAFKASSREFFYKNFKVLAIILAIAYGASDEFHQYFVSARTCEALDLTADMIGGTIGALFYGKYHPF